MKLVPLLFVLMPSWWVGSVAADEPTFQQLAELKRIGRDLQRATDLLAADRPREAASFFLRGSASLWTDRKLYTRYVALGEN